MFYGGREHFVDICARMRSRVVLQQSEDVAAVKPAYLLERQLALNAHLLLLASPAEVGVVYESGVAIMGVPAFDSGGRSGCARD